MDTPSSKKIKFSVKQEEDMKKPLSKINEDPESYRTMFNPPMYNEDLKHINPRDRIGFDWNKFHNENGIVPKPDNGQALYVQSAESIAAAERIAKAERERVAKRTAEEAFDQMFTLKKLIRELDGIFNFLNLLFY